MATASTGNSEPLVAINVTPFVDVVLVLLVIFMATSSYISNPAIEVDLPEAASGGEAIETTLALVLTADGKLYLNGDLVNETQVANYCQTVSRQNPKVQAIIAADGGARHDQVVRLIDVVKLNGVHSFALNIDVPSTTP
jgi:biopolymer transport protein ExbD